MTQQHTPTPWTQRNIGPHEYNITDGEGYSVAHSWNNDDAAFIVTAVNAHDDLVAALTATLANVCQAHGLPPRIEAQARAALAKAKASA